MKIGAITIGQTPRTDVTSEIMHIFNGKIELIERGGLDGLTAEDIKAFAPSEDDYVLVSKLRDGTSVMFAEKYIVDRLQKGINELEAEGVKLIMVFCTGRFPESIKSNVPLVYPGDVLHKVVPLLSPNSEIITITPSPLQVKQFEDAWLEFVDKCTTIPASPYGTMEEIKEAALKAKKIPGDLIVLDCIGYTQEMKNIFAQITGKMVLLPRTLLARVVSEVVDI